MVFRWLADDGPTWNARFCPGILTSIAKELGLGRYIDTPIRIDTDLADTVSIRLDTVSRYFQKCYEQQIW